MRPLARRIGVVLLTFAGSAGIASCMRVPLSARASFRMQEYLATNPELLPSVLDAMKSGHVIPGMDRQQVRVVLGVPVRTAAFGRRPDVEVWIYPGHRLHQDQMRADKAWLFRLVFVGGILTAVEPI